MRKKFDYWGVPFSELFPNYHAPHTVECDCGERAKCIKSYRFVSMSNMREKIYLVLWRLYFD